MVANKKIWLGILVMALVFGMTVVGCDDGNGGGGGGGNLDGTWVDTGIGVINGMTLILSGSNYSLTGDMISSGTYTRVSDGKDLDLTFTETSPGSETYTGSYNSKDKIISAAFTYGGLGTVTFSKQ